MSKSKKNFALSPDVQAGVDRRNAIGEAAAFQRKLKRIPLPRDFSEAPVLFEVQGLTVYYNKKARRKKHPALNNVNFSVKEGEVVFIMGRNGSGKSTILDVIAGRSKAKVQSGSIKTSSEIFDLSKKDIFSQSAKHKIKIKNLGIWDEDDHRNQGALGEALRERSESKNTTSLIVSHQDVPNIFNHADKIIFIEKGEILWLSSAQEAFLAFQSKEFPKPMMKFMNSLVKNHNWNLRLSEVSFSRPAEVYVPKVK